MGNLLSAFILFSTVVISVALGIVAAYGAVIVVLQTFGSQPRTAASRKVPVPVLVTSESHAGGD